MRIQSNHEPGLAPVSPAGAAEREETRLQHAVTKLAGLVVPPHQAIDGDSPAGRLVDDRSLKNYARAILGMWHDADKIDPTLAPYLAELSRNESTDWALPVTRSSFTLLCILYVADQIPGPAAYGQFGREDFRDWLNRRLAAETVRYDCIPDTYFNEVQVTRNPETGFTNRCAVRFGPDLAHSVEVQAMHRTDLRGAYLRGAYLRGADLRCANLQGANLEDADLRGINLQGANLQYADLRGANLQGAHLEDADLLFVYLRDANLHGAELQRTNLGYADLQRADLRAANLRGAVLQGAVLGYADLRGINLQGANLHTAYLRGANLRYADLQGAHLGEAGLEDANLECADLRGANLRGAYLDYTTLQGADLRLTNLQDANLQSGNLR